MMKNVSNIDFSNLQNNANFSEYAMAQYLMNNVNTIAPCSVTAVNKNSYNVELLVNYMMANNQPKRPSPIFSLPKMMVMGGNAGIITELKKGDKVLVGFCQRDISTIKEDWKIGNPASLRKFDMRDGIILGVLSSALPLTYVKITDEGIEIKSPHQIVINSNENVTVKAPVVNVDSMNINLGNAGVGVLTGVTQFQVQGVQAGNSTLPVQIVSRISTTVKASS